MASTSPASFGSFALGAEQEFWRLYQLFDGGELPEPQLEEPWDREGYDHVGCVTDDNRVRLGIDRTLVDATLAVLIAHEVAHVLTPPETAHGEEWRSMFTRVLARGYGYHATWPRTQRNRRMNYELAHELFWMSMRDYGFRFDWGSQTDSQLAHNYG